MKKAVAIVSGGLDSVTLAYHLADEGFDLHLLSFDYGQKHERELRYAKRCAVALGAEHTRIDLSSLRLLLSNSALTSQDIAVPDGNYTDESMRITVVPNRNAIMLSIAVGVAINEGATCVAAGFHSGDHPIYPDCRPVFVRDFMKAMLIGNEGFAVPGFRIYTPFLHWTKAEIVQHGATLDEPVPFEETYSCYKGGNLHCGTCGTCTERQGAFCDAGVSDPTLYQPIPDQSLDERKTS